MELWFDRKSACFEMLGTTVSRQFNPVVNILLLSHGKVFEILCYCNCYIPREILTFIFLNKDFILKCVCVCVCVCVWVCVCMCARTRSNLYIWIQYLQRPEGNVRSPWVGATGSGKLLQMDTGNLNPLQELWAISAAQIHTFSCTVLVLGAHTVSSVDSLHSPYPK